MEMTLGKMKHQYVEFLLYKLNLSHLSFISMFLIVPVLRDSVATHEMLCAIYYHLYTLQNVKSTHGGVLLLIKLQLY